MSPSACKDSSPPFDVKVSTLSGLSCKVQASKKDTVGKLRDLIAASIEKPRCQVALLNRHRRLEPDSARLEELGICGSNADVGVLIVLAPLQLHMATLTGKERAFEAASTDSVGDLRVRVATWLQCSLSCVALTYMDQNLEPDDRLLDSFGFEKSKKDPQLGVILKRQRDEQASRWSTLSMDRILAELAARDLITAEEIERETVERGAVPVIEEASRGIYIQRLVAADEQERQRDLAAAWVDAAQVKKQELLQRRSLAMDECRKSYSHIQNGGISRALIGGGPITKLPTDF